MYIYDIKRPPSISELTSMIFNMGLTYLDSEASIYDINTKKTQYRTKNLIMNIWKPPRLSELSPMIFNMGLTDLGSKASIYSIYQ